MIEVEPQPLTLTLPSSFRVLPVARAFTESACAAGRLEPQTIEAVVLAVHEALRNVIRHAHHDRPELPLQIHIYLADSRVEIHVLDEGAPFDLAAVPRLDPSEVRPGGRGVFLMRALMDEVSCQPRGDHGNVLRLVKFRTGAARPRAGW